MVLTHATIGSRNAFTSRPAGERSVRACLGGAGQVLPVLSMRRKLKQSALALESYVAACTRCARMFPGSLGLRVQPAIGNFSMKRIVVRMSALSTVVLLGWIAIAQAQRGVDDGNAAPRPIVVPADARALPPGANTNPLRPVNRSSKASRVIPTAGTSSTEGSCRRRDELALRWRPDRSGYSSAISASRARSRRSSPRPP